MRRRHSQVLSHEWGRHRHLCLLCSAAQLRLTFCVVRCRCGGGTVKSSPMNGGGTATCVCFVQQHSCVSRSVSSAAVAPATHLRSAAVHGHRPAISSTVKSSPMDGGRHRHLCRLHSAAQLRFTVCVIRCRCFGSTVWSVQHPTFVTNYSRLSPPYTSSWFTSRTVSRDIDRHGHRSGMHWSICLVPSRATDI